MAEEHGEFLFAIDEKLTSARRRHWTFRAYLPFFLPFVWPVLFLVPIPVLQIGMPSLANLLLLEAMMCTIPAASWLLYHPLALRTNRIAIATKGLYPPTKPKGWKTKGDWFVAYRDIVRMNAAPKEVEEAGGWPVYDVNVVDGAKFRISAYDIWYYAKDPQCDIYSRLLEAIQREVNATLANGERIIRTKDGLDSPNRLPVLVTERRPWNWWK